MYLINCFGKMFLDGIQDNMFLEPNCTVGLKRCKCTVYFAVGMVETLKSFGSDSLVILEIICCA